MRRTLLTILSVLAGLLVVVPAPPAAAAEPTAMSITGTTSVASGGSATIFGVLKSGRAGLTGRSVVLQRVNAFGMPVAIAGADTTGAGGIASVTVDDLTATSRFRWFYAGNATEDPAVSPVHTVHVESPEPPATTLTIGGPDTIESGGTAALTGQLFVAVPPTETSPGLYLPVGGKTVTLSRSTDGTTWTPVGSGVTNVGGLLTIEHTDVTTTAQYRWSFAGDAEMAPSTSAVHVVTVVSGEPDPPGQAGTALTIHTEPSVISTGESAVVHGTLWSGGEPLSGGLVALRASTDNGATWTTVDSQQSGADGELSALVSPTAYTAYQWRFAGTDDHRSSTSPTTGVTINDQEPTTFTIDAPDRVSQGDQLTIRGHLTTTSTSTTTRQRTVRLERSTDGGATFETLETVETDKFGLAQVVQDTEAVGTTTYRWAFDGTPTLAPTTSRPVAVTVVKVLPTKLTMGVSKKSIVAGNSVTVSTALTSGLSQLKKQTVELWATGTDGEESLVATALTGAKGKASVTLKPLRNKTYRWRLPPQPGFKAAASPTAKVDVEFKVQLRAGVVTVKKGGKLTVSGSLKPGDKGVRVDLLRKGRGLQAPLDSVKTNKSGGFTLTMKATTKGAFQVRVRAVKTETNAQGMSQWLTVRVK